MIVKNFEQYSKGIWSNSLNLVEPSTSIDFYLIFTESQ